jgi:hypothetical protein
VPSRSNSRRNFVICANLAWCGGFEVRITLMEVSFANFKSGNHTSL